MALLMCIHVAVYQTDFYALEDVLVSASVAGGKEKNRHTLGAKNLLLRPLPRL